MPNDISGLKSSRRKKLHRVSNETICPFCHRHFNLTEIKHCMQCSQPFLHGYDTYFCSRYCMYKALRDEFGKDDAAMTLQQAEERDRK